MMLSTFGFDMVEPIYIEFMVDDFLISISSSGVYSMFFFKEINNNKNLINPT